MYSEELTREIEDIIKQMELNCSVEEFRDETEPGQWCSISEFCCLSEAFIREFEDKVFWYQVSNFQRFSEDFIREFQHKVEWRFISIYNKLSEDFIREMHGKVCWINISMFQDLSESFLREFQHEVHWGSIARHQKLSESFIREFSRKMDVKIIMASQNLSPEFVLNFSQLAYMQDPRNMGVYNKSHRVLAYEEKLEEVRKYCKEYNLELDIKNKCFYAYRYHDELGSGHFNKTISYKKGKYYRDWHLDMNGDNENSFGLGIFPKGNTRVKVLVDDWGVQVNRSSFDRRDGKCRVWGFEIV